MLRRPRLCVGTCLVTTILLIAPVPVLADGTAGPGGWIGIGFEQAREWLSSVTRELQLRPVPPDGQRHRERAPDADRPAWLENGRDADVRLKTENGSCEAYPQNDPNGSC